MRTKCLGGGYKHFPETIANLHKMHTGKLHPRFGQVVSEEQKLLTSLALKKYSQEHDHHSKGKKVFYLFNME